MNSHTVGTTLGGIGAVSAVWWLYHNPAGLSSGVLIGLTIVLVLIMTIILLLESISRKHSTTLADWFDDIEFY